MSESGLTPDDGRRHGWVGRPHPATGIPQDLQQQVPGTGPLGRVSRDLDEAYYYVSAENRRKQLRYEVEVLFACFRLLGLFQHGPETPTEMDDLETVRKRRPRFQDTTTWIRYLSQVEDAESLCAPAGPDPDRPTSPHAWEDAICWSLDVRLAASELPPSRQRLMRRYADGFGWNPQTDRKDLDELAQMGEGIAVDSVRDLLRETSRHIRRRSELNVPAIKARPRKPRPGPAILHEDGGIQKVEREWAKTRRSYGSSKPVVDEVAA